MSSILTESLREPGAPPPLLVARLYIIADVLHNCATPGIKNASTYRNALQVRMSVSPCIINTSLNLHFLGLQVLLPDAFEALGAAFGAMNGRLHRENMRSRVMRVLSAWTVAAVFPQAYLSGLTATFFREASRPPVDPQEAVCRFLRCC